MALEQSGQGVQNEFVIPVYYAPPPGRQPNVFAAFWHSFLATRNPWATKLFDARLSALDPSAKADALLELQKMADARDAQRQSTLRSSQQSSATLMSALIAAANNRRKTDADLSKANLEARTKLELAATTLTKSNQQVVSRVSTHLQELARVLDDDSLHPADKQKRLEAVEASVRSEMRGVVGTQAEKMAVVRHAREAYFSNVGTGSADLDAATRLLGDVPETEPRRPAGVPGKNYISDIMSELTGAGLEPADLGGGSSQRVSVQGPAGAPLPSAPLPSAPATSAPATSAPATSAPLLPLPSVLRSAPSAPETIATKENVTAALEEGKDVLGGFGDPLPFGQRPGTERILEALRTRGQPAEVDPLLPKGLVPTEVSPVLDQGLRAELSGQRSGPMFRKLMRHARKGGARAENLERYGLRRGGRVVALDPQGDLVDESPDDEFAGESQEIDDLASLDRFLPKKKKKKSADAR